MKFQWLRKRTPCTLAVQDFTIRSDLYNIREREPQFLLVDNLNRRVPDSSRALTIDSAPYRPSRIPPSVLNVNIGVETLVGAIDIIHVDNKNCDIYLYRPVGGATDLG